MKYIKALFAKILYRFCFNVNEKETYKLLKGNWIVVVNYIYQRWLNINSGIPYSVNYTSKLSNNMQGLHIENNCPAVIKSLAVSGGCYIGIHQGSNLFIGENTIWAYGVSIVTGNHDFIDRNKYIIKDVKIGKNCWLAAGCKILPGVELGDNVTVAANAVVTKSFPSNVVIGGVPAKILKYL